VKGVAAAAASGEGISTRKSGEKRKWRHRNIGGGEMRRKRNQLSWRKYLASAKKINIEMAGESSISEASMAKCKMAAYRRPSSKPAARRHAMAANQWRNINEHVMAIEVSLEMALIVSGIG